MEVVVVLGGLGTRLRQAVPDVPGRGGDPPFPVKMADFP